jgi:hypothetical protein
MANLFLLMSKLQSEFSLQLTDVPALVLLHLSKFAAFVSRLELLVFCISVFLQIANLNSVLFSKLADDCYSIEVRLR